ncbi:CGNR zinc finger domain-containing protein [Billgrantia saliphila]|uniref:CGNR zinc finger domain-containing protein n=1 Tax=Billgrantia saliphila TaxID=1848458 RepID=UPI000CE53148|nr:CGNR zinc finger domain-containing protein [Halomonas saliphila]
MTEEKWNWLGDHLAVDLANTVRRRGERMAELLSDTAALEEWFRHERERLPEPGTIDEGLLSAFLALRDDTLSLLRAAVAGEALPEPAVARVNAIVTSTPLPRVLGERPRQRHRLPARSGDAHRDVLATLADAVVDLLGDEQLYRLAFCDAPSCGQFFHRQRPNQSWCCPACGDRVRAARHHHRRTGGRDER